MADVIRKTTNRFTKGLVMDFSPENTKNELLTHALNATLLTFNGNELSLQNDMGNARVETAYLPEGYMPVGACEYGGIIYIVSYNPLEDKSQIGCFPSPERNISSKELGKLDDVTIYRNWFQDFDTNGNLSSSGLIKHNSQYVLLKNDNLNPGLYNTNGKVILNYNEGEKVYSVKKGDWENCKDFCYWNMPLYELDGKTLGIIGFGKIGRRVSELAKAFGMNVMVYTPSGKKDNASDVEFTDMDVVLRNSDFITVHCPLTEKTAGLINNGFISKLKDGACVINTARGGVANEDDIANALKSGKLSCYCADVLSTEPPKSDNPLLTAPNCFITPHIAWAAYETRLRLMGILEENIKAYLNGAPINVVNS